MRTRPPVPTYAKRGRRAGTVLDKGGGDGVFGEIVKVVVESRPGFAARGEARESSKASALNLEIEGPQ
jgi:hypothetical protein